MASHSKTTRDHDEIRSWAEERGGKPSHVAKTESPGDIGILRLEFPGATASNDSNLEEISWDQFFEKFDERGLALIYQDETAEGAKSNFNKLVSSETADEAEKKTSRSSTAAKRTSNKSSSRKSAARHATATKTAAKKTTGKKSPAKKAPAKKTAAKKAPVKKGAAKKTAAKKSAPAKKRAPAKKTAFRPAKKSAAKSATTKKTSGLTAKKTAGRGRR